MELHIFLQNEDNRAIFYLTEAPLTYIKTIYEGLNEHFPG